MKNIIIIDTETIDLQKRFIYDVGFIVANLGDEAFTTISEQSFIIKQIYDNKILFNTGYYANKRPLYVSKLKSKKSQRKHYGHTLRFIEKTLKLYSVNEVYAYNSDFDKNGFEYNSKFFKSRNPLRNKTWIDIHAIANNFIHSTEDYQNFAKQNGFVTQKGYIQTNAEVTYKYLMNDLNFQEEHTGLEDCKIELDILNECIKRGYDFRTYKKMFIKA